ncbi:MAG: Rab family GTPase [Candidatus Thorarchaeota archaeon]|jgi:GTPase SAR1 family protein
MSADYRFKIVMLGDGAVGKTALTTRFTQEQFDADYKRTIGSDFAIKRLEVPEKDSSVTLQVWDLRRTFLNAENWKEEAFKNLQREIPLVVVANKVDLVDSRIVTPEEGKKYADEHGHLYVESSALTGENVEQAYTALSSKMIDSAKDS